MFVFDGQFASLTGFGTPVELKKWYDVQCALTSIVFRSGHYEELAVADQTGRIRVYSLAAQQFRYV